MNREADIAAIEEASEVTKGIALAAWMAARGHPWSWGKLWLADLASDEDEFEKWWSGQSEPHKTTREVTR